MADYITYFNGEWIPVSQAKIDIADRGFTKGDVVYDVERTFGGIIFQLEHHIDRLYRSLKYVRIDPGMSPQEMIGISEQAVIRNEHLRHEVGDYYVRQFITRGKGTWAHSAGPPTICVRVDPLDAISYAHLFEEGINAVIPRTRSYSSESVDSKIKHYSRMNFNLAELEAGDVDLNAWPILTDGQGNITEGTTNNVFLISNGVIRTPKDESILQGGSRSMVFDLAKRLNIPVVEESIQPYDLYNADEAFFSRTGPCILPVTNVDNRDINDGEPGPITNQLLAAWGENVGIDIVDQAKDMANKAFPRP